MEDQTYNINVHDDSTLRNLNHSNSTNDEFVSINKNIVIQILLIILVLCLFINISIVICYIFKNYNPNKYFCCICNMIKRKKGLEIELGNMIHKIVKNENIENIT